MAKAHKLSALQVQKIITKAGMYGDGACLWLHVTEGGSKSWILRYMICGTAYTMGLGPYPDVSLLEARDKAAECRKKIRDGRNPLTEKREQKAVINANNAKAVTFDWCAEQYIEAKKAGWKNAKHVDQWRNTIATYASPIIGNLDIAKIEMAHIMRILEPIWTTKSETASRLRGRLENVLDWAKVRKYRTGENPARWKGHLDTLLPATNKIKKVVHHAALPWKEIGVFMPDLRKQDGIGARALEFAILTAARSGEVRGATWQEINIDEGIWIVPGNRMKAGREHRVPLSKQAAAVAQQMKSNFGSEEFVFPGIREGKPLSDMSLTAVLRRMGFNELTAHGFRSTFRDWTAEATKYPSEMAEMALAHTVSDKVEAAYRRGDMFEKRRHMMQHWADFTDGKEIISGEVISLFAA